MSTTIPHTHFPHIIDSILAHSDTSALNVFRATARSFRDRVDALHLSHVVLFSRSPHSRCVCVWGATLRARIPCLSYVWFSRAGNMIAKSAGGSHEAPRVLGTLATHTQTVDIVGSLDGINVGLLQLPRLETLRLRPDASKRRFPAFPWAPRTVVLFSGPVEAERRRAYYGPELDYYVYLPRSTRRVILNNAGTTTSPLHYWPLRPFPSTTAGHENEMPIDIVVMFPEYTADSAMRGRFPHWTPNHAALGYTLGDLAYDSPRSNMVLIGLDEISSEFNRRFLGLMRDALQDAIDLGLPAADAGSSPEEVIEGIMANVSCASMEEYAYTLESSDALRLETVEDIGPSLEEAKAYAEKDVS